MWPKRPKLKTPRAFHCRRDPHRRILRCRKMLQTQVLQLPLAEVVTDNDGHLEDRGVCNAGLRTVASV